MVLMKQTSLYPQINCILKVSMIFKVKIVLKLQIFWLNLEGTLNSANYIFYLSRKVFTNLVRRKFI